MIVDETLLIVNILLLEYNEVSVVLVSLSLYLPGVRLAGIDQENNPLESKTPDEIVVIIELSVSHKEILILLPEFAIGDQ